MSESKSVSDTPETNSVQSEVKSESKADKVAYETYSKVLSEAKKLKEKLKTYEDTLQKQEEEKLKSQNEWKTLAEQYKNQLTETSKSLQEKDEAISNGIKYDAFRRNLGGELIDEKEFIEKVPFDKIVINPETKQIDEDSAKMAAAEFAKKYPYLVSFKQGKMPNAAPKPIDKNINLNSADIKSVLKEALNKW